MKKTSHPEILIGSFDKFAVMIKTIATNKDSRD
jgi:hypothetical protein